MFDVRGTWADEDIYDWTQVTDELEDGDLFRTTNAIGFLYRAWPTQLWGYHKQLHTFDTNAHGLLELKKVLFELGYQKTYYRLRALLREEGNI